MALELAGEGASRPRPRARLWDRPDLALPILLVAPSAILMVAIVVYPMAQGFYYGFTNGTLLRAGSFVGLQNYMTSLGSAVLERGHVQRHLRRRQRGRLLCPGARARAAAQPRSARARLFPDGAASALDRSLDRSDRELAMDAGGRERSGQSPDRDVRRRPDLLFERQPVGRGVGDRDQDLAQLSVYDAFASGGAAGHRAVATRPRGWMAPGRPAFLHVTFPGSRTFRSSFGF